MKIALGADHAGVEMKQALLKTLETRGHSIENVGTDGNESCHYPVFAAEVARMVAAGEADRGILVCGTGIGMAIAANRFKGVRAANCNDLFSAKLCRLHNDANVLTMGARMIGDGLATEILTTWLDTPYEGGRHQLRLDMLDK